MLTGKLLRDSAFSADEPRSTVEPDSYETGFSEPCAGRDDAEESCKKTSAFKQLQIVSAGRIPA